MGFRTTFLFARPSFFGGAASAIDMGGTLIEYNESPTGAMADYIALRNDWASVGEDIKAVINQHGSKKEQAKSPCPAK